MQYIQDLGKRNQQNAEQMEVDEHDSGSESSGRGTADSESEEDEESTWIVHKVIDKPVVYGV